MLGTGPNGIQACVESSRYLTSTKFTSVSVLNAGCLETYARRYRSFAKTDSDIEIVKRYPRVSPCRSSLIKVFLLIGSWDCDAALVEGCEENPDRAGITKVQICFLTRIEAPYMRTSYPWDLPKALKLVLSEQLGFWLGADIYSYMKSGDESYRSKVGTICELTDWIRIF
jgi:hypothetical protein